MLLALTGSGHNVSLTVENDDTVAALKQAVAGATGLAAEYQRLLHKGKRLDDDNALLSSTAITNGSKLMLLHSPAYARDADAIRIIEEIAREISEVQAAAMAPGALEERCTRLCCRLDSINVSGSESLRQLRRQQLQRCEALSSEPRRL
mmetsp:Transcript_11205/g.35861  ORF Transcript_11205/g.35861 Transcript_11205/m.35861 type:complete len:149 (+) Transcript_11205:49-495(+)|eukprot:scaffold14576_cov132-Isochrysis_galbana.AAC.20